MEPVEHAGCEEPRHGDPSPLHQHAPKAEGAERFQNGLRREALRTGHWKRENLRGSVPPLGLCFHQCVAAARPRHGAPHHERPGGAVREHGTVFPEATVRIEHHPDGILPLYLAHSEPGIVVRNGAGSHDHGVDQSTKPMDPSYVFGSGDVVGPPAHGRDPAVQALAELSDDEIGAPGERQIEVEHLSSGRRGCGRCRPGFGIL